MFSEAYFCDEGFLAIWTGEIRLGSRKVKKMVVFFQQTSFSWRSLEEKNKENIKPHIRIDKNCEKKV